MNTNMKIIDVIKVSFSMLEKKDKYKLIVLSIGSLLGSLFELLSLTSVIPFVSLVLNKELIKENNYLNFIWEILRFIALLSDSICVSPGPPKKPIPPLCLSRCVQLLTNLDLL